ncbi:hypothetical protein D3C81_1820400 [compost metagenome]
MAGVGVIFVRQADFVQCGSADFIGLRLRDLPACNQSLRYILQSRLVIEQIIVLEHEGYSLSDAMDLFLGRGLQIDIRIPE